MPPFRLEAYKSNPQDNKIPKTIYCKKEYSKGVKVTDWNMYQDSEPIDTDPYCPEGFNLLHSHYRFLGTDGPNDYRTTTQDMLESGLLGNRQQKTVDYKKMIMNFYTFDSLDCPKTLTKNVCCPEGNISNSFITTMQHSYQMPYPYEMKRLSLPTIPFYQNRKLACGTPGKFLDDNFSSETKLLQRHKSFRDISYNPCTNLLSDGTIPEEIEIGCVNLE